MSLGWTPTVRLLNASQPQPMQEQVNHGHKQAPRGSRPPLHKALLDFKRLLWDFAPSNTIDLLPSNKPVSIPAQVHNGQAEAKAQTRPRSSSLTALRALNLFLLSFSFIPLSGSHHEGTYPDMFLRSLPSSHRNRLFLACFHDASK